MDLDRRYQLSGRGRNGSLIFTAATDDTTLITATNSTHTLYLQRLIVWITTSVAQSLTFQDSAASPLVIAVVPASPGANTRWEFYFGARGIPLTLGKNLVANFSAAGLAGHLEWNAYETPIMKTEVASGAV